MSGGAKEIIRVEEFASDAVVLRLASDYTTRKIIFLDSDDSGNKAVTVFTLVFIRVISFAINSRTAGLQERSIYSC